MKNLKHLLLTLLILACASSSAWARMGVLALGGGISSSCSTGNILSESFDPTGGDATWNQGYITDGCTSTLDQTAPTATGFSGQSYNTIVDSDAYSEAWSHWTDSLAKSTAYARFYLYINSEGLSNGQGFRILGYGVTTTYPKTISIYINQYADQLSITVTGPGLTEDSYNISTGTSYLVELYLSNNGASDSFEWKINESSQGTQSGALFDNDFQKLVLGVHPDISVAAALNVSIDKLDISSSGWLGKCE